MSVCLYFTVGKKSEVYGRIERSSQCIIISFLCYQTFNRPPFCLMLYLLYDIGILLASNGPFSLEATFENKWNL